MKIGAVPYLGGRSIKLFGLYITAYQSAREELSVTTFGSGEEKVLDDFSAWLNKRQGVDCHWIQQVWMIDSSDQNLDTFLALFEEFINKNENKTYKEIFDTSDEY